MSIRKHIVIGRRDPQRVPTMLGLGVLASAVLLSPVVARSAPVWEPAEAIASSSTETFGEVLGLSCVTDDDCVMVGYLGFNPGIAVVAEKVGGTWGPLQQNVGLAAIPEWNPAASTSATSVSCMPSGECVVVGSLTLTAGGTTGYVATRTNGTWSATVVPGLAALSTNNGAPSPNPFGTTSIRVSCDASGTCATGGQYIYGAANNLFGAWVAHRGTNGTWSPAIDVPGVPGLNTADNANVSRLSCPGDGNCVAIGTYRASNTQAFIVELVDGVWGQAFPVPGLLPPGGLNQGAASFEGLDCVTFSDCAASGRYWNGSSFVAFVVNKVDGTWGSALAVPGLDPAANIAAQHVSCPAVGACALTAMNGSTGLAYVASQVGGTWQAAQRLTFAPSLDAVLNADAMRGISCSGAGECIAIGTYRTPDYSTFQAWQAVQSAGSWAEANSIPGMDDLLTDPPSRSQGQVVNCVVGSGCNVGGVTFQGAPHRFFAAARTAPPLTPPKPPVTTDPPTTPTAVTWIPTPANQQPRVSPATAELQREGGQPAQLNAISSSAGEVAYVDDDGLISVVFTGDRATSVERGLVATRDGMVRCEVCSLDLPEGSIVEIWAFSTPRLVAAGRVDERGCIDEMIPLFSPLDGGPAIESGQHTLQVILPMDDGGGRLAINVGVTVGLRPGSLPAGEGVPTGAAPMGVMFAVALAGLLALLRRRGQGLAGSG